MELLQMDELIHENIAFSCICTDSEEIKEVLQYGDTSEILNIFLLQHDKLYIYDVDEINILKNKIEYITIGGVSFRYAFPVSQFIHYNE